MRLGQQPCAAGFECGGDDEGVIKAQAEAGRQFQRLTVQALAGHDAADGHQHLGQTGMRVVKLHRLGELSGDDVERLRGLMPKLTCARDCRPNAALAAAPMPVCVKPSAVYDVFAVKAREQIRVSTRENCWPASATPMKKSNAWLRLQRWLELAPAAGKPGQGLSCRCSGSSLPCNCAKSVWLASLTSSLSSVKKDDRN